MAVPPKRDPVSYTASEPGTNPSGLAKVELYVKRPGDSSYTKAATDTAPGSSGSFNYSAAAGDGAYSFYTVATDTAGNAEAQPASGNDTTTQLDTNTPTSAAQSPTSVPSNSFAASYPAPDPCPTRPSPALVELYAKRPGDSSYNKAATDAAPGSSGSFNYSAAAGDGAYSFYTVATDKAGNAEAQPPSADATTHLDTNLPTSAAQSPASVTSNSFAVSYTASDPGTNPSGLAKVELYVKRPGDSSYTKAATDTTPGSSGSFNYSADADAGGNYSFYTVATDKAGNAQAQPGPDTTTFYGFDGTA